MNFLSGTVNVIIKSGDFKFNAAFQAGAETETKNYTLEISGNALDTNITPKTEQKTIAVSVSGQTKGFATSGASIRFVKETPKSGEVFDTSKYTDGEYVYTVEIDGKIKDSIANFSDNTFTNVTKNASGAAVLLAKGAYTVKAYKVTKSSYGKLNLEFLGTKQFTVTDNQTGLTWAKTENAEKLDSFSLADMRKAFTVKFGDTDVSDKVTFEFTNDTSTAYIKKIFYVAEASEKNLGTRVISVDVDTLIRLK